MKKLHSLALCALLAPAITFSAGSVLAQQSTGQGTDRQQSGQSERGEQRTQRHQGDESQRPAGQSEAHSAADRQKQRMQGQAYMESAPSGASKASNLIGSDLRTSDDEEVGSVSDILIDADGQVVAIIVGVGGFLGIGEKDVAISWDNVTQSGTYDDRQLQIDVTRQDLRAAPEYKDRD